MAKKAKKKWIQQAIKHPGALTKAAKAAGKSIREFCASGDISGTNKRRCALMKTLQGMHKK